MKNPNGFGSVIKLSGKRRRPFAVRISDVIEKEGEFRQKFIYLDYFEKRKDAINFLAKYNSGFEVKKAPSVTDSPTFEEIYKSYMEQRKKIGKNTEKTEKTNKFAFNHLTGLHKMKFRNITVDDLQEAVLKNQELSRSSLTFISVLLRGMYKYALQRELVERDLTQFITMKYAKSAKEAHTIFTEDEIKTLWKNEPSTENLDLILILIYTGMRVGELMILRNEDIHLDERYMIGGEKTEAGRNRAIPISDKIYPFIEKRYSTENEYFYNTPGRVNSKYDSFLHNVWKPIMANLHMDHKTHDCRKTCSTLLKKTGVLDLHRKKILGHAITDLTDRLYTTVEIKELVDDINKI